MPVNVNDCGRHLHQYMYQTTLQSVTNYIYTASVDHTIGVAALAVDTGLHGGLWVCAGPHLLARCP